MKFNYKPHDREEAELLHSLENEEWQDVENFQQQKVLAEHVAKQSLNKIKRVNLRLTERDFDAAHVKAIEQGIPYQTLLSSVIHKYLSGRLKEV